MSIDLDAFREGIRPKAGDWNRGWNMTLLTLLQRAGVSRVLSIAADGDQPEFVWDVEIIDHHVLNGVDADVWDEIETRRAAEISEIRADLDAFVRTVRQPEKVCITRTVFELIEPRSFAPPRGRCPACCSMGIFPPAVVSAAGLEKSWAVLTDGCCRLPDGLLLLAPSDPNFEAGLSRLVATLTSVGIDQIVAPAALARSVAHLMVESTTRLGFVIDDREWSRKAKLASVPSAILLPDEHWIAEPMIDRIVEAARDDKITTIVVARPDRCIRGRRLDQTISRLRAVL